MRRALKLDPEYALAWAGLADAYSVFAFYGMLPGDVCAVTAREAAAKAIAYGPDLAESHNAVAEVSLLFDWDWCRTEQSFRRALEINPGHLQSAVWYGYAEEGFGDRPIPLSARPSPDLKSSRPPRPGLWRLTSSPRSY